MIINQLVKLLSQKEEKKHQYDINRSIDMLKWCFGQKIQYFRKEHFKGEVFVQKVAQESFRRDTLHVAEFCLFVEDSIKLTHEDI